MDYIVEALAVVASLVVMFGSVFGTIAYGRYLRYRETLVLAEKGLLRAESVRADQNALRWGIVIASLGLALCVGLYPFGFLGSVGRQFPLHFGPWMLVGLLPLFFGLGLVLIYVLTSRAQRSSSERPDPIAPGPFAQDRSE